MVGFFVPAGFEPVTLTSQSGLTTHYVTNCPTPRGRIGSYVTAAYVIHLYHLYLFLGHLHNIHVSNNT